MWCWELVKRHRQGLTINPLPLSCLINLQSLVMWCKLKLWTVYEEILPLPPLSTLTCFACSHCGSVAPDHISTSIINYCCLHAFVHPQTHSSISQTNLCSSAAAASLLRTYKSRRAPVCCCNRANICSLLCGFVKYATAIIITLHWANWTCSFFSKAQASKKCTSLFQQNTWSS